MKSPSVLLRLGPALLLLAAGCSDPFGVMRGAPSSQSSPYRGYEDERPRIQPRVVPQPDQGPLSLAQCVEVALENSAEARLSWQGTRSAAAALGQARGTLFPQLDFTATGQRAKYQDVTNVQTEYMATTYNASFGVRQLLFNAGASRARVSAAEAALRTADFRHNATLLDLGLATEVYYYQLLAAQSLLQVAEDTAKQRAKHLDLAQKRYESGVGRWVDVLQAKAEKAGAELGVVESRSQVRTSRGRLAAIMGWSAATPVEIIEIPEGVREMERRDVDALMEEAAWNRPNLKGAASEVMRMRRELTAQRAACWPEITGGASYGWRDTHILIDEERNEWTLSVSAKWPLFTGFQRTYALQQGEIELAKAIDTYEKALRDVELEVWIAYSTVIRAEEALNAADVYVDAARENQNVAERAYQEGRANIVELIDAQTGLTTALARRVGVHLEWYTALSQLERAVGKSLGLERGIMPVKAPEAGAQEGQPPTDAGKDVPKGEPPK